MALFTRKNKIPLGIYVHIPFCRSKCQYCDFYSLTCKDEELMDRYLEAICAHIRETGPLAPNHLVDTVYFGGGTPSYFGPDALSEILTTIRKAFDVSDDAEITFEANPDSVDGHLLRRLRVEGFNRVSLGIQCDDDKILKKLGRPHSYLQAVEAVRLIRKKGFRNLSVDLMFGLPGQSLQAWEKTLHRVLKLSPEHISCYGLKVEERTPLYSYWQECDLADDDTQADMYLAAVQILKDHGYRQYEISNFCKRGHVSRHNLKYWQEGEYLGFGPDASSDFGGRRFAAVRDINAYIDGILGGGQILRELHDVPQRERAGDYLMLRLRTVSGIDPEAYEKQFLLPFAPLEKALWELKNCGYAAKTYDGRWHLTPEGFLISNTIICQLQEIQDKTAP